MGLSLTIVKFLPGFERPLLSRHREHRHIKLAGGFLKPVWSTRKGKVRK
jgi:hypothetical protein